MAFKCFLQNKEWCASKVVSTSVASWHHYRSSCNRAKYRKQIVKKCEKVINNKPTISTEFLFPFNIFQKQKGDLVKDTCVWNVKENVLSKTKKVLEELELI